MRREGGKLGRQGKGVDHMATRAWSGKWEARRVGHGKGGAREVIAAGLADVRWSKEAEATDRAYNSRTGYDPRNWTRPNLKDRIQPKDWIRPKDRIQPKDSDLVHPRIG